MHATATAHPNIALVKYWGKRDAALNLPREGSLSLTLAGMESRTSVRFDRTLARDQLVLDGTTAPEASLRKAVRILDDVRRRSSGRLSDVHAQVESTNDFPTGAGLASSASGFAALACAAAAAADLELAPDELSVLARLGSGSACRSVLGGFVEWRRGERDDGLDSHAVEIAPPSHWNVAMLVAVVAEAPKSVSSTEGMERTRATSPFYEAFLASIPADLASAREAVLSRELAALGVVMERNCLRMHAAMLAAEPALVYLRGASLAVTERVRALRHGGTPAYFTIDAGPNVKVLCESANAGSVEKALAAVPGVIRVIRAVPGPAARIVERG
ncbi:MAG: diphosphomevalonate decarboxylase [bacterium]